MADFEDRKQQGNQQDLNKDKRIRIRIRATPTSRISKGVSKRIHNLTGPCRTRTRSRRSRHNWSDRVVLSKAGAKTPAFIM